jgi:hypothetical protein
LTVDLTAVSKVA